MITLHRIRFKAATAIVALGVAAFGAISIAAMPAVPVIGAAITAAMFVVHKVGSKLDQPVCRGCGTDLAGLRAGAYGVACPECGRLNQVSPVDPARDSDRLA